MNVHDYLHVKEGTVNNRASSLIGLMYHNAFLHSMYKVKYVQFPICSIASKCLNLKFMC